MAFIDHDEIEKITPILPKSLFVGGSERLIDAEVHVAALTRVASGNLVAGIAKGRKHLRHRIVHKDVSIRQE